jgi:hypothetical protein
MAALWGGTLGVRGRCLSGLSRGIFSNACWGIHVGESGFTAYAAGANTISAQRGLINAAVVAIRQPKNPIRIVCLPDASSFRAASISTRAIT